MRFSRDQRVYNFIFLFILFFAYIRSNIKSKAISTKCILFDVINDNNYIFSVLMTIWRVFVVEFKNSFFISWLLFHIRCKRTKSIKMGYSVKYLVTAQVHITYNVCLNNLWICRYIREWVTLLSIIHYFWSRFVWSKYVCSGNKQLKFDLSVFFSLQTYVIELYFKNDMFSCIFFSTFFMPTSSDNIIYNAGF